MLLHATPFAGNIDQEEQHAICGKALSSLLNIGVELWKVSMRDPEKVNKKKGKKGIHSN